MSKEAIETQEAAALKVAEGIADSWSVGSFSRFCDEPADFDAASESDIAAEIIDTLNRIGWKLVPASAI